MKKSKNQHKKNTHEEENKDNASIRGHYVNLGVKQYYETQGGSYLNPHEDRVRNVIKKIISEGKLNTSKVLDLACGSGEVTLALREYGVKEITGVDPYTFSAYEQRTGMKCQQVSFEDIANGKLSEEKYGVIICSYALHLAKDELLPVLAMQMSLISQQLLIITPHKRPEIGEKWGWSLANEIVLDRTRARLYNSLFFETN